MPESEEVTLSIDLRDDISAALRRIEQRLEALDRQMVESAATAKAAGREIGEGLDEVEHGSDDAAAAQRRLRDDVDETGRRLKRQRRDIDENASGLDRLGKRVDSVAKKHGGFARTFSLFKWPVMIAGGVALGQTLIALGGAAVIAVGNLAPLAGVLGPLAGLFFAAKMGMLVWKTAAEALKPQLDAIKEDWKDVGKQVAAGGLGSGIDDLRVKMSQFRQTTADGMTFVGAKIGDAASRLGDFLQQKDTLQITTSIWEYLGRIVGKLLDAMLSILPGVLRLILAVLPSTERLAEMVKRNAEGLNEWLVEVTESGRATEFFNRALDRFTNFVGAVWKFMGGLVNIFRIAGGVTGDLTVTMENAAARFKAWTESADGQNKIRKFFEDIKPVVHEVWLLIKDLFKGIMSLGTDPNLAPLIKQIRTELLPALLELLRNFSGSDLLPALISGITAALRVLASIDPQGLIAIAYAIAGILNAIAWASENIPGFSFLISAILTLVAVGGPLLWIVGKLEKAFKFLRPVFGGAAKDAKELSWVQQGLRWVWEKLSGLASRLTGALRGMGGVSGFLRGVWDKLAGAGRSVWGVISKVGEFLRPAVKWIGELFKGGGKLGGVFRIVGKILPWVGRIGGKALTLLGGPVGWVIGIVWTLIDVFMLLYDNCEWFRNAVDAVWGWIKGAASDAWDWIVGKAKLAWNVVVGAGRKAWEKLVAIADWFRERAVMVWNKIVSVVKFVVGWIVYIWELGVYLAARVVRKLLDAWYWVTDKITGVVSAAWNWIYSNIIEPVIDWISRRWAEFVGYLSWCWDLIKMGAQIAWNFVYFNIIKPVVDWVSARWAEFSWFIQYIWYLITSSAQAAWNWLYFNIIKPVVDWVTARWNEFVGFISYVWSLIVAGATIAWNWLYFNIIKPVADWVTARWNEIVWFFSYVWYMIKSAAQAAWDWIWFNIIKPVADWVTNIWTSVRDFFAGVWRAIGDWGEGMWNRVKNAASGAADWIKNRFNDVKDAASSTWDKFQNWVSGQGDVQVGGTTFSPPTAPAMAEGGYTGGRAALTGEQGPEPLVRGSKVIGMTGMNGPQFGPMPRGSHVVPNLSTLSGNPGLAKRLPASVAGAVSRAMPGYDALLNGTSATPQPAEPSPGSGQGDPAVRKLAGAVSTLERTLEERPPPISVSGGASAEDNRKMVRRELDRYYRRLAERSEYDYGD